MSTFQIIVEELPQRCEQCGIIDETRPYGLNHEELCFDCAMKDEALTKIRANQTLLGNISSEGY